MSSCDRTAARQHIHERGGPTSDATAPKYTTPRLARVAGHADESHMKRFESASPEYDMERFSLDSKNVRSIAAFAYNGRWYEGLSNIYSQSVFTDRIIDG